jgi:hypothetical protein
MSNTQQRIDWSPPAPPPVPAAADPHCPAPARRRAHTFNRALLCRLMTGEPLRTGELEARDEAGRLPYGKRYCARIHDVREWLRELGYDGDPVPRRCLDSEALTWEWRMTPEAVRLAAEELRGAALAGKEHPCTQ